MGRVKLPDKTSKAARRQARSAGNDVRAVVVGNELENSMNTWALV